MGPIRALEWERLWITHLYPLKASKADEEEEEEEEEEEGEEAGQRGSHWPVCADGFQPWHVTRISPVVTHFQPAVTLSRCSHAFRS